jgi:hypothetical protein
VFVFAGVAVATIFFIDLEGGVCCVELANADTDKQMHVLSEIPRLSWRSKVFKVG